MIVMADRPGRTDISATEAGNTVTKLGDNCLVGLFIEAETFSRTDIKAESASTTGLFFYGHFQHFLSPHPADNVTLLGYYYIKCHLAYGVGRAGQAGIITADNKFKTVEHCLITGLFEQIICPFFK